MRSALALGGIAEGGGQDQPAHSQPYRPGLGFWEQGCCGLLDPVVGGYDGGKWLKEYARKHEIDLERSVAFAGHGPDLLLLSSVGQPCAVNPDFTLRKAAKEADWPIMEFNA